MAEFVCKVADSTGRVFRQVEAAQSKDEARQRLADQGLYVYTISGHVDVLKKLAPARSAIRPDDFLVFNQQFNTLVKAGLPILKALDLLAERAAAPKLRPILQDVRERVRNGALLSEAMAAQGSFSTVYVTVISAGERSGNLSGVLDQYIAYLRTSTSFRAKLITTLIYPCVLVIFAFLVVSYFVLYAMPAFSELYKELQVPLPWETALLLALAAPLRSYFIVFLAAAVAAVTGLFLWTRSEAGALAVDRFKPRVPLMGEIWLKAQVAQTVRTLSTLLGGGTPLVTALMTSASAMKSKLMAAAIIQSADRVKEGRSLHASLAETGLIPGLALEMVEVGEASGALTPMLASLAEFYEEEVGNRLQRALSWVPIAILIVMALVIGFIVIAIYLPMFSLQAGAGA